MYFPQALDQTLEARQLTGDFNDRNRHRRPTRWSNWGRWVFAGVFVFIGLILLIIVLCCSKRRKRNRQLQYQPSSVPMGHQQPVVGTVDGGYYNQGYNNHQGYDNQGGYAPPRYGAANDGYYGQQGGVTQPQGVYVK